MAKIVDLIQGSDGFFQFKILKTDGVTYYDLGIDFTKVQVYCYTDGGYIAKYDRDGDTGFTQMNVIDSETLQYWITGADNLQMNPGQLKFSVWTKESEPTLSDLLADSIGTGIIYNLINKPPFV